MTIALNAAIPSSPLVDANGWINPEWRAFFTALYLRTGGSIGQSTDTSALEAQIAAETAARQTADTGLSQGISNEANQRTQADVQLEHQIQAAVEASTYGWQTADAGLVPKAQLCSLWAACDLSFLPATDPGGGKPWLDGNHIVVGTPAVAVVGIGLEDGTGRWALQDGTGAWIWG